MNNERGFGLNQHSHIALLDQVSAGILTVDKDIITSCNKTWLKMTGYDSSEVVGKSIADITYPGDPHVTMSDVLSAAEQGQESVNVVKRYRCKDGSWFWGDLRVIAFKEGGCLGVVTDVTDRRQAKDALRASEGCYRGVLKDLPGLFCCFLPMERSLL